MTFWLIAAATVCVFGDKNAKHPDWVNIACMFLLPVAVTLGFAELVYLDIPYLFTPLRELCQ
jgi:uncharacterized membrane protein YhdT